MELINSIFIYFTDKGKGLSHKSMTIIFSLLILFVIDNTLNFSNNYNNSRKIEQIEKLNNIISDSTLTESELANLKKFRTNIIHHKTGKDKIYEKIITIDFKPKKTVETIVTNEKTEDVEERNFWLHFISSSWLFMIIIIIIPFMGLFGKETSFFSIFIPAILFIGPIFLGLSWLFAKIFSYIPIINNNPNFNYILNAILHFIIILFFSFMTKKNEK